VSIVLGRVGVHPPAVERIQPAFTELKNQGQLYQGAVDEAFARWPNLKLVLLALFGATAGQAVVWYGWPVLRAVLPREDPAADSKAANLIHCCRLLIGTPFFVVWGSLSDRIGRKTVVLAGCVLAALTYFPVFKGLTHFGNRASSRVATNPVVIVADSGGLLVPIRPHRQEDLHALLRRREVSTRQSGRAVHQRGRAGGTVTHLKMGSSASLDSFAA